MSKKLKIVSDVLGSYYSSSQEHLFYCPYCEHHKKKFSINIEKNCYKCWVCDQHGRNIRRVIRRFGNYSQLQLWDELSGKVDINQFEDLFSEAIEIESEPLPSLPEEFISLANKNLPITALPARNYLKTRNITKADILKWKIGYCNSGKYSNRIIIPSFNDDGYVNYFVARSYDSSWKKYLNPSAKKDICFNELYVEWDSDLILTEGVFDAIIAGPNAIPLLGSTLREESRLFQKIIQNDTSIFLALDPDAKKKEEKIIRLFLKYGIELYNIDISGFSDVGEMTKQEFKDRKQNASFIQENDYLLHTVVNSI